MASVLFYGGAIMGGYIVYKYAKGDLLDIPISIYKSYRDISSIKLFQNIFFEPYIKIRDYKLTLNNINNKWQIETSHYSSEDLDNLPNHHLTYKIIGDGGLVYIEYNILIKDLQQRFYKQITSIDDMDVYNNTSIAENWKDSNLQPSKIKDFIDVRIHYNKKVYNVTFINEYMIIGNILLDKKFIIFYLKKYFNISVNDEITNDIKTTLIDGKAEYKELNSEQYIKITDEGYDIIN